MPQGMGPGWLVEHMIMIFENDHNFLPMRDIVAFGLLVDPFNPDIMYMVVFTI